MSKKSIPDLFLRLLVPEQLHLNQSILQRDFSSPWIRDIDFQASKRYLHSIWVCHTYDTYLKHLMEKIKLGYEFAYAEHLFRIWLFQYQSELKAGSAQQSLVDICPDLITFVPSDPRRRSLRGFHLPEILSRLIAEHLGIMSLDLVKKVRHTEFQSSLDREARLLSPSKVLAPRDISPQILDGYQKDLRIWLIDDICTTGATLHYTAEQIQRLLPKVDIYGVVIGGN